MLQEDKGSKSIFQPPTKRQLRDLKRILEDPPDELANASTVEKLVQLGMDEAEPIFRDVEDEWKSFLDADARSKRTDPPIPRLLERWAFAAAARTTQAAWALSLSVAVIGATFWPTSMHIFFGVFVAAAGLLLFNLPELARFFERSLVGRSSYQGPLTRSSGTLQTLGLLAMWFGCWAVLVPFFSATGAGLLRYLAFVSSVAASLVLSSTPFIGSLLQRAAVQHERRDSAREAYRESLKQSAFQHLREKLNLESDRSYQTTLAFSDHSGLGEMDDPSREIPTKTRTLILEKMRRMPGGTIGLAGSRGAGKTTLMRSICTEQGTRLKEQEPLGVVVDAPVRYEPRDFILYLFARICTQVVGAERVREMRGSDQPFGFPIISSWVILASYRLLLGIGSLFAGIALIVLGALDATDALKSPFAWGLVLIFIGYVSITVQTVGDWQRRRRISGKGRTELIDGDDPNIHTATLRLRQIWFQQSFSTGWSGGFKTPIGIETGLSGSTELAEQQLSFPDIVDLFRDFLRQVALRREVRIGIDELDKMDDETARRFLNEIKVIFRIPDCFFFVSISEDAMSFFERRGLPVRDVFDSSFDDVQHVPHLEFQISKELLDRRIVGLPIPFSCFLHCASGGLPRDLIRVARNLVQLDKGTPLTAATAELLAKSLNSKVQATKVAARGFQSEDHVTLLITWLDRVEAANFAAPDLLDICCEFEAEFLGGITTLSSLEDLAVERRELQALGTQLVAFAYYSATMLQFFEKFDTRAYVEEATSSQAESGTPLSAVDQLAAVSQTFAVDVNAAWGMLTQIRSTRDLGLCVPFPRLLAQGKQVPSVGTDDAQSPEVGVETSADAAGH